MNIACGIVHGRRRHSAVAGAKLNRSLTGTKPAGSLNMLRIAAPALLAVGTGYFLTMFADSLI